MKATVLLLAALFAPLFASADTALPVPGAQANVTVTLTLTEEGPTTVRGAVTSSRLITSRYGNQELISDLNDEGLLPDHVVAGWKLVVVDRTPLRISDGSTLVFYLIKKNKTPVEIPASRLGIDTDSDVSADAQTKTTSNQQVTSTKSSFKSVVTLSGRSVFDGDDHTFTLTAMASGTSASSTRKLKVGAVLHSFDYDLLGAVKLSPIIGKLVDNALVQPEPNKPIEGSISFSAFSAIDITSYPYTSGS